MRKPEAHPVSKPRVCSRCKQEPAEPRQRWGRQCFTDYKRTRAAARMLTARGEGEPGEPGNQAPPSSSVGEKAQPGGNAPGNARGNRGNAPATRAAIAPEWIYQAPERFTPFRDTPGHGPEWAVPFLADYAVHGGKPLAAARAGVTMTTVERHAQADPVFAEEVRHALEYHRALLEWESLNLGRCKHSPLPYFDRLKAELPARHVDRALIASVNVTAATAPPYDTAALLRAMLADASPATRAMLGEGPTVIELPEADSPR
jgi:hypothetical protein